MNNNIENINIDEFYMPKISFGVVNDYKYIPKFYKPKVIKKGWGQEVVIANNKEFCGKLLIYNKAGVKSSAHFHAGESGKHEVFHVYCGSFLFNFWDEKGFMKETELKTGDAVEIPRNTPHRLTPLEGNSIIFEVSNEHKDEDVVRFIPGASQKNEQ